MLNSFFISIFLMKNVSDETSSIVSCIMRYKIKLYHKQCISDTFYFSLYKLTMDDVSSETCFVFIKKYKKNDLQDHCVVHQSDNFMLIQSLENKNYCKIPHYAVYLIQVLSQNVSIYRAVLQQSLSVTSNHIFRELV